MKTDQLKPGDVVYSMGYRATIEDDEGAGLRVCIPCALPGYVQDERGYTLFSVEGPDDDHIQPYRES